MKRTLVALALALALVGCGEDRAVRDLVRRYNDAAIRAYRLNDASGMTEVATRKEADRVLVLVDLKASNRLVLESTLERFVITSARVAGDRETAVVETEEQWRYFDRPVTPGRQPGPTVVAEMAMRYELLRESGKWKVMEVSTLRNQILEPKGYSAGGKPSAAPPTVDAGP